MLTYNETYITKQIIPEWLANALYHGCPVLSEEDGIKIIKTLTGVVYVRATSNNNALAHSEMVVNE